MMFLIIILFSSSMAGKPELELPTTPSPGFTMYYSRPFFPLHCYTCNSTSTNTSEVLTPPQSYYYSSANICILLASLLFFN